MNLFSKIWRGFKALLFLAVIAGGGYVLWRYPGEVQLEVAEYSIVTPLWLFVVLVCATVYILFCLYRLQNWIFNLWPRFKTCCQQKSLIRQQETIYIGLAAFAGEDYAKVDKLCKSLDPNQIPLALMLKAQSAYLQQDWQAARLHFEALRNTKHFEFLGIRGLILLAEQEHSPQISHLLHQAYQLQPQSPWVQKRLIPLALRNKDWAIAEKLQPQFLGKQGSTKRIQSISNWLKAKDANDISEKISLLKKAYQLAPEITQIVLDYADCLYAEGKYSKAVKVITTAYPIKPHRLLGKHLQTYLKDAKPLTYFKTIESMTHSTSSHPESIYLLADAAVTEQLWGKASQYLKQIRRPLDRSIAGLWLQVYEAEENWGERSHIQTKVDYLQSEPSWSCLNCGAHTDTWNAFCPSCEAFDQIEWTNELAKPLVALNPPTP